MSEYTPVNDFSAKDSLTTGDPEKVILGADMDAETAAIQTAMVTKYDSSDLASQAQAEAESSNVVLMTPGRVANWSDFNAGIVGDLQAIVDPNVDVILGWDDSAGAAIGFTVAGALTTSGTVLTVTAANLLTQLLTVDGAGSGLDADLLDAQTSSFFLDSTNQNAGTLPDARLSSQVPLKNVGNVFTVSPQTISAASPQFRMHNTSGAANTKYWITLLSATQWVLKAYADDLTTQEDAIRVTRGGAGHEITLVELIGDAITLNGINTTDLARLSQANVFTANQSITKASPILSITSNTATDAALELQTNSTIRGYIVAAGTAGGGAVGSAVGDIIVRAQSGGVLFSGDSGSSVMFGLSSAGGVTTKNLSADEVGYKGVPTTSAKTSNYTAVLTDASKQILCTTTPGFTVTIPSNASVAFPIGTVLVVTNITGGNITIAITTDSMALGGTGSTGSRTLFHNGMASITKVTSNAWIISGPGVS